MIWKQIRRRSPIGITISSRSLTAVQFRRSGSAWRLGAIACYERADHDAVLGVDETRLFAEILGRQGFHGTEIVLAVPNNMLKNELLEVPAAGVEVPMTQLARMELARTYKCRPDSFELATWGLPDTARNNELRHMMAAACMHHDSESLMEVWELGGMEVIALDIHSAVVASICRPLIAEHDNISAALDINWDASNLVIMHQDAVIYDRTLSDSGLAELHDTLMKRLNLEPDVANFAMFEIGFNDDLEEKWADWPQLTDVRGIMATHFMSMLDELRVSFSYAQHRYPEIPVDRLFLLGRGALIPDLQAPISSMLDMDTQILMPGVLFNCPPSLMNHAKNPELMIAAGLAGHEN